MSDNRDERPPTGIDEEGSVVSGPRRRELTATQKLAVAGLVLVVFLSLIWLQQLTRAPRPTKQPYVPVAGLGGTFKPAPIVLQPPPALPMPIPASQPMLPRFTAAQHSHEMTPAESPIFAFSGSGSGSGGQDSTQPAAAVPVPAAVPANAPPPPQTALSAKLRPTTVAGAKATLLPHPDMLLTMGTIIPCTLQTAIDSELAGYVKCVLPQDVRSTTGNVVLLDRGTTVVGEIQDGLVNGEDRVFVLWDRAETPDHAVIELDSPGVDELGRSGLAGAVNNHFWKRFGGAIMLSVIQGALQAGTAVAGSSGSGSGTFFSGFQSNGQELSSTALRATINIPPTLTKNQGDNVAIFVTK
ncbi:MAG: type IV secretion system protein VirB10, partial [Janthinobacterium lividum]